MFDISDIEEPTVITWVLGIIIPTLIILLGAIVLFRFRDRLIQTCLKTEPGSKKSGSRTPGSDENENVPALEEHIMLKTVRT